MIIESHHSGDTSLQEFPTHEEIGRKVLQDQPQQQGQKPGELSPAQLRLLEAEFEHRVKFTEGTIAHLTKVLKENWKGPQLPRAFTRAFEHWCPGKNMPRDIPKRTEMLVQGVLATWR